MGRTAYLLAFIFGCFLLVIAQDKRRNPAWDQAAGLIIELDCSGWAFFPYLPPDVERVRFMIGSRFEGSDVMDRTLINRYPNYPARPEFAPGDCTERIMFATLVSYLHDGHVMKRHFVLRVKKRMDY